MYATARDTYRRRSEQINAITQGRNSANSGLPEDTIPAFARLSPQSNHLLGLVTPTA